MRTVVLTLAGVLFSICATQAFSKNICGNSKHLPLSETSSIIASSGNSSDLCLASLEIHWQQTVNQFRQTCPEYSSYMSERHADTVFPGNPFICTREYTIACCVSIDRFAEPNP
jgi:hypothetical protein